MKTEGGYSDVGHALGVSRMQVYRWHHRGTRNMHGERFPRPVREEPDARRTTVRYVFSIFEARRWYNAGMPEKNPNQHTWAGMS